MRLDYDPMGTSESSMGLGRPPQAATLQRLGTLLDCHPQPDPTTVTLTDEDGLMHTLTLGSDGTRSLPPGLHHYLWYLTAADCLANGNGGTTPKAWLMTAPDRNSNDAPTGQSDSITAINGRTSIFFYPAQNTTTYVLSSTVRPTTRQLLPGGQPWRDSSCSGPSRR